VKKRFVDDHPHHFTQSVSNRSKKEEEKKKQQVMVSKMIVLFSFFFFFSRGTLFFFFISFCCLTLFREINRVGIGHNKLLKNSPTFVFSYTSGSKEKVLDGRLLNKRKKYLEKTKIRRKNNNKTKESHIFVSCGTREGSEKWVKKIADRLMIEPQVDDDDLFGSYEKGGR